MAISKSAKIEAEIEKVKAKITEQQARLKELEQKKVEAENSEIVDIVRGMSIPLAELPVVLQQIGLVHHAKKVGFVLFSVLVCGLVVVNDDVKGAAAAGLSLLYAGEVLDGGAVPLLQGGGAAQ